MVSIDSRLRRTLAAAALSLAGAIAPFAAHAQPTFRPAANDDRQDEIVARIAEQEARYGPYSPQLLESWTDLAKLYHDDRSRALEAAAIAQALQISHAIFGLHSLEQAPLLQQILRSHEDLGDAAGVWELERELMELADKHPLDPRTASIWAGIGDHRMQALARYAAGGKPPELVLGCFYVTPNSTATVQGPINCTSGSRGDALSNMFRDAEDKYERAVEVLLDETPPEIEQLRALDRKIVLTSYLYSRRYREQISARGYHAGAKALQRLYAYDQVSGEPASEKAAALVKMADWDTLFASNTDKTGWSPADPRPTQALATYEEAYQLLEQDRATRAQFDALFAPAVPVVLPAFEPNPLLAQTEEGSTGFIDVVFDITKYGRSTDIRLLDTTSNASRSAKTRLTRLITVSRFRPQAVNGRLDTAHVGVRYYLSDPVTTLVAAPDLRTD